VGVLAGRRVAVLRAAGQGADFAETLREEGAEPVLCPAIAIMAPPTCDILDAALANLASYEWIVFASANAVAAVAGRMTVLRQNLPSRTRLAAIGPATAAELHQRLRHADVVAGQHHATGLARSLAAEPGARVLLPAGNLAGPEVERELRGRGLLVDVVTAYHTVPDPDGIAMLAAELRGDALDAVVFTRGSTARFAAAGLGPAAVTALGNGLNRPAVVCIGPSTAAAALECGLAVHAVADPSTTEGVMDALRRWFAAGA
jgi:uroporphyrinogen-III synthase